MRPFKNASNPTFSAACLARAWRARLRKTPSTRQDQVNPALTGRRARTADPPLRCTPIAITNQGRGHDLRIGRNAKSGKAIGSFREAYGTFVMVSAGISLATPDPARDTNYVGTGVPDDREVARTGIASQWSLTSLLLGPVRPALFAFRSGVRDGFPESSGRDFREHP